MTVAYVNGAAQHEQSPVETAAVVNCGDNQPVPMPSERLQKIRQLLSEPFDPGEIKWRVRATSTRRRQYRESILRSPSLSVDD